MRFFAKELSWLSFNERVLQEACDPSVPVIERVRFLGIFSSNMDEFFQVRVAEVRRQAFFSRDPDERQRSSALLEDIQQKVLALQSTFDRAYQSTMRALAANGVKLRKIHQLNKTQTIWLENFFQQRLKPNLVPIILTESTSLANMLQDDEIYFAVKLHHPEQRHYAVLEVPTDLLPRFIQLPTSPRTRRVDIIMLDDIVHHYLDDIFSTIFSYDSLQAHSFKVTRDADYRIRQDIEQSFLERLEESLKQRFSADPVRLVYEREMPRSTLQFICQSLNLNSVDSLVAGGRYRNTRDFIKFPDFGLTTLNNPPLLPIKHPAFAAGGSMFEVIRRSDVLAYYPYHDFSAVTELLRQSACDPKVSQIKICVYRLASESRVARLLIDAVNNGKRVHVNVELQARFDEEANMEWAKVLEDAGVEVTFGIQGLKVHAKVLLIYRHEASGIRRYAHIGTGNFNEKTANIYTDFGLFTSSARACEDVDYLFQFLDAPYRHYKFQDLLVSPLNTRTRLSELIEFEISQARDGLPASIFIKVNNLVDETLIVQLYRASRAGVKIRALVRGMCSLRAGIKDLSENIEVRSIVDRFLEHARVYQFHNKDNPRIYISSADLMTRNLDHRVEASVPLHDKNSRDMISAILELQWQDNCKSRIIDSEQTNQYILQSHGKSVRSQIKIYELLRDFPWPMNP